MHRIRKGQVQGVDKGDIVGQIAWIAKVCGVAAYMQREGHSMLILFLPHSCNTTVQLDPGQQTTVTAVLRKIEPL